VIAAVPDLLELDSHVALAFGDERLVLGFIRNRCQIRVALGPEVGEPCMETVSPVGTLRSMTEERV
jgi:hypothetical protein